MNIAVIAALSWAAYATLHTAVLSTGPTIFNPGAIVVRVDGKSSTDTTEIAVLQDIDFDDDNAYVSFSVTSQEPRRRAVIDIFIVTERDEQIRCIDGLRADGDGISIAMSPMEASDWRQLTKGERAEVEPFDTAVYEDDDSDAKTEFWSSYHVQHFNRIVASWNAQEGRQRRGLPHGGIDRIYGSVAKEIEQSTSPRLFGQVTRELNSRGTGDVYCVLPRSVVMRTAETGETLVAPQIAISDGRKLASTTYIRRNLNYDLVEKPDNTVVDTRMWRWSPPGAFTDYFKFTETHKAHRKEQYSFLSGILVGFVIAALKSLALNVFRLTTGRTDFFAE
ncbi:hypothetical protein KIH27_12595 [Mycobacterium sp. M1]|uniref:Uncharacterized protein n=1 Tax=Mycolicibacter acidiphilus TaxID=2835306 RepID=A0ABS5RNC7_9MYCO|nr:hypothetical protein [Mycolicibacter acidiphilus]MBS9534424.1 hypothetical protein [Mycolicibacter acidiphilus]